MLHIFKASAGSGKTFTLAKEYITMLLAIKNPETGVYTLNLNGKSRDVLVRPFPHRSILAITFTRKATEEMKRRIIKELAKLATIPEPGKKDSLYAPDMMQRFLFNGAPCSRHDLATTASLILHQLLFDYQNFNISTIDAFFQRIMHTFARELGQQSDYEIELDSDAAMRNAVGIMLDDFNSLPQNDSPLERWLTRYMQRMLAEGKASNFFNRRSSTHSNLVKLISKISEESFQQFELSTKEYLRDEGTSKNRLEEFTKYMRENQAQIIRNIQEEAIALGSTGAIENLSKKSTLYSRFSLLVSGSPLQDLNFYKKGAGKLVLDEDYSKSIFNKNCGTPEQEIAVRSFYLYVHQQYTTYFLMQDLHESLSQLGLLKHAWGYLDQFNRDNNTLLLAQTNTLISQIIDGENSPFVYERLGVYLNHFLIDEFQDTSTLQWANLWPLVLNAISDGNDSLVIGDEKQSIYRWRNSDSEILHTGIESQLKQANQLYKVTGGNTVNYRSAHNIVRFNNSLFSRLADIHHIPGFENVVQGLNPDLANLPGHVKFFCTDKLKQKIQDDDSQNPTNDLNETILAQMVAEMRRLHEGGYQWRDMAILVRRRKEAVLAIDYLAKNCPDISVLSEEALKVSSSNAVQLIINTLRIIDQEQKLLTDNDKKQSDPDEVIYPTKAEVMADIHRFAFFLNKELELKKDAGITLSEEEMAEITANALNRAVQHDTDKEADDIDLVRQKKPTTLVSMVEAIIGQLFSPEQRKKQFTYLAAFQDLVIDFCQHNQGTLHEFLDWWKIKGVYQNVSGAADANAVQVLTIHKAKGLEFPCVLIPFCTWRLYGDYESTMWTAFPAVADLNSEDAPPALYMTLKSSFDQEDHPLRASYLTEHAKLKTDTANMTYVAFTRAINELLVWYGDPTSSEGGSNNDNAAANPLIGSLLTGVFATNSPDQGNDLLMDLSKHFKDQDFEYGAPTAKAEKAKDAADDKGPEVLDIDDPYPINYPSHAASLLALNDVLDNQSDIDDYANPDRVTMGHKLTAREEEAMQKGTDLHEIMSHIRVPDDMTTAINRVVSRRHLDNDTADEYSSIIATFLHGGDQRVARWFDEKFTVYMEQPIYIPNIDQMRRPDRIVVLPDGSAEIIDYKFTQDTSEQKYFDQVKQYMALVKAMGYPQVRGYLCFPLIPEIIEVK